MRPACEQPVGLIECGVGQPECGVSLTVNGKANHCLAGAWHHHHWDATEVAPASAGVRSSVSCTCHAPLHSRAAECNCSMLRAHRWECWCDRLYRRAECDTMASALHTANLWPGLVGLPRWVRPAGSTWDAWTSQHSELLACSGRCRS